MARQTLEIVLFFAQLLYVNLRIVYHTTIHNETLPQRHKDTKTQRHKFKIINYQLNKALKFFAPLRLCSEIKNV